MNGTCLLFDECRGVSRQTRGVCRCQEESREHVPVMVDNWVRVPGIPRYDPGTSVRRRFRGWTQSSSPIKTETWAGAKWHTQRKEWGHYLAITAGAISFQLVHPLWKRQCMCGLEMGSASWKHLWSTEDLNKMQEKS